MSSTSEELKELGNKAFAEKNFPEATEYYSKAIKLEPNNHVFFSNRSASHAGLKNWALALEDAKECIRLDPTFLKGYYRLATAQVELKDFTAALATIRQGLSIDASHPQLLKLLRTVQQQQQRSAMIASGEPMAPAVLDETTMQELEDLKVQYKQSIREHGIVQAQLTSTQRQAKVAELTKQELEGVSESAKFYRSVGKVFLRSWSDKTQVMDHLTKQVTDFEKQESDLIQKMEYLERRIKSQRQNMEEVIASASNTAMSASE